MKLKDIMTPRVQVVRPFSTLKEAAQLMKISAIGLLPVCDGDRLIGMISDRDITTQAVAEGRDVTKTSVQEIMNRSVLYAFEDQDVAEAAHMMEKNKIRRLVILDRSKRLVGMVSIGDLARQAPSAGLTQEVMAAVAKPPHTRPRRLSH